MSNNQIAVLWVLVSTGLWAVIFASAKLADGAVGTFQIMWLRYLGGGAVLMVMALRRPEVLVLRASHPVHHLLRACLGCGAAAAITWATAHMRAVDATSFGMLYGVLAVVFGVWLLGERLQRGQGLAIGLAVCGAVVLAVDQGAQGSALLSPVAWIAVMSAVLMALEGVMIRILSAREGAVTMMNYVTGFGILLLALPALMTWQPLGILGWGICLALGPLSLLAQYTTIRGYRMAPLSVVGPVDYAWLLFALAIGWLGFGEVPTATGLAGAALIVGGGILLMRAPDRKGRSRHAGMSEKM